ncbi:hypothetical protein STEG23_007360 [Scotinomys teguina]
MAAGRQPEPALLATGDAVLLPSLQKGSDSTKLNVPFFLKPAPSPVLPASGNSSTQTYGTFLHSHPPQNVLRSMPPVYPPNQHYLSRTQPLLLKSIQQPGTMCNEHVQGILKNQSHRKDTEIKQIGSLDILPGPGSSEGQKLKSFPENPE